MGKILAEQGVVRHHIIDVMPVDSKITSMMGYPFPQENLGLKSLSRSSGTRRLAEKEEESNDEKDSKEDHAI